jgi:son of sevenless-like protein
MSLVSALNSSTIDRLKKTWELLNTKSKNAFDLLRKATDLSRNYANYRLALKQCPLPCLPFLGLYLTDLTFTQDGNPDTRGNDLINFDKHYKTSRIIVEFQRFQLPYTLHSIPDIQDYLARTLDGVDKNQDTYERSLLLEPRENSSAGNLLGPPSVYSISDAQSLDTGSLNGVDTNIHSMP